MAHLLHIDSSHPGRPLGLPRPQRPRRRPLAPGPSRRDRRLPRPRRRSGPALRPPRPAPRGWSRRRSGTPAQAGVLRAERRPDRGDQERRHPAARPAGLQLRPAEHRQGLGRPPDRPRHLDDPATPPPACSARPSSSFSTPAAAATVEGTPREGWDHAEPWLPHAVSLTALEPRFITAELTLAETVPAMFELKGLAAESLARAEAEIDGLWASAPAEAVAS